ncbi:MAG: deoxyribodipyrimidine photo-lyase, partial [Chitinophagaceae bacterium]|nr:deoxyribodipyrimidine photo-lyase [Chitinophagaceae bacterium]
EFQALGSDLKVCLGKPLDVFNSLINEYNIECVFANTDYEPYAITRDEKVLNFLAANKIQFKCFKDQIIFDKDEVTKDDGTPYTVFTPYSKKWKAKLNSFYLKPYPVTQYLGNLFKTEPEAIPTIENLGFEKAEIAFLPPQIDTGLISKYNKQRDFPAINGTSRLSMHLRFGTISIRHLAQIALDTNETWLNELIWREFYMCILYHFPNVVTQSFKPKYDNIEWRNNEEEFDAWCNGKTGYPIVDAGMRELNATGFMHNRVRMIVASFLTKHLLIDWRWGEAYFASKLLDYDLAANNGGWQWAAGCGCDAAPYFRIFNPYEQTKKFDKDCAYIKKWVPEFQEFHYPKPIVDHKYARERVLSAYKKALN